MDFEDWALALVYQTALGRVCNCRRQDSESDPAGHELWCDIGYGPEILMEDE